MAQLVIVIKNAPVTGAGVLHRAIILVNLVVLQMAIMLQLLANVVIPGTLQPNNVIRRQIP